MRSYASKLRHEKQIFPFSYWPKVTLSSLPSVKTADEGLASSKKLTKVKVENKKAGFDKHVAPSQQ